MDEQGIYEGKTCPKETQQSRKLRLLVEVLVPPKKALSQLLRLQKQVVQLHALASHPVYEWRPHTHHIFPAAQQLSSQVQLCKCLHLLSLSRSKYPNIYLSPLG